MKTTKTQLTFFLALLAIVPLRPSECRAGLVPQPIPTSEFANLGLAEYTTGVVRGALPNGSSWTGTGAVVSHPKVVLTCAHVVYEAGQWLSMGFTAHHHAQKRPTSPIWMRGYYKTSSYSSAVRRYGASSNTAYNSDVAAGYAYEDLAEGHSSGHFSANAATALTARNYTKKTVGYPKEASNNYYMYRMQFNGSFKKESGAYYGLTGATTFGGNSGGPVFARLPGGSSWYVAGVVVSGNRRDFLGVRALDSFTNSMLANAASSAGN